MTVNKPHGTTYDATRMLGDDLLYRELAYEAMSRGRKENRIYMSRTSAAELDLRLEDGPHAPTAETDDALDILAAGFERRPNKQLALDSIAPTPVETWSTADLVAERRRIETILHQASPDRAGDLAALGKARAETDQHLEERRAVVTELESRKRPRRERRQPDFELTTAKHNLAYFEKQADRLAEEIAALHASQHRRTSHLVASRAARIELDAIEDVLNDRLRRQINRPSLDIGL